MKIAILSSTITVTNGYGNITYELCTHLKEKGIDFTLFLPEDEPIPDAPINFLIRRELPSYRYMWRPFPLRVVPYMFPRLDLRGYTLVHSLFEYPYAYTGARLARAYRIPFVMGGQGTYAVLPLKRYPDRYMLMYAYTTAKEIMVASAYTKNAIEAYAGRTFPIQILHNGVNVARFDRALDLTDLKKKYEGRRILLTVGALTGRKGHDIVIRALPEIVRAYPDVLYLIVGEGGARASLEKLVRDCGVEDHVAFVGSVKGDGLVRYFHLSDIYVHTPRVKKDNPYFEGFGIVYLEASACGKPIVATDAGGIRDAVIDGETGLVARDEDSAQVAEYCIQLLGDAALRARLGEKGKAYARAHDWGAIADQYIERYRRYSTVI